MAKRRAKKKNQNRSGFLLMFGILLIMGGAIYFYRDRLAVLADTTISASKKKSLERKEEKERKSEKKVFDLINTVEQKFKKYAEEKKEGKQRTETGSVEKEQEDVPKVVVAEKKKPEALEKTAVKKKETPSIEKSGKKEQPKEVVRKEREKENVKKQTLVKKEKESGKSNSQSNLAVVNNKAESKIEKNGKRNIVEAPKRPVELEKPVLNQRTGKIYFSRLDEDGSLRLVAAYRKLEYVDTPLTATLNALLKGPTFAELENDILTNVPDNTVLRKVTIKNGIAYVDLSANFEFNPYGRESTLLQLKQIVYTVTEFRNVRSVQFLINGKVKNYLGGDGVVIDKPLSRDDFT